MCIYGGKMSSIQFQAERCKAWLKDKALPLWLEQGFDKEKGIFWEGLETSSQPYQNSQTRFRVQPRQVYVYSHAMELGWIDAKTEIAHCLENGFSKFQNEKGEFIFSVDENAEHKDTTHFFYDYAFALLGYAWDYHLTQSEKSLVKMEEVYQWVQDNLSDNINGGYFSSTSDKTHRSQNPHMHFFESLMVCYEVTDDQKWMNRVNELYQLVSTTFIEASFLREFFDENLGTTHETSKQLDPGHHYEWTWLLAHYAKLSGVDVSGQMMTLNAFAKKYGHNNVGLVCDEIYDDGSEYRSTSRLWCQTEHLKAQVALFELCPNNEHKEGIIKAVDNIFNFYLDKAEPGLWVDHVDANGKPLAENKSPASTFYHIFLAFSEIIRLADKDKTVTVITPPSVNYITGRITSENLVAKSTLLSSLKGIYSDDTAFDEMDPNQVTYQVEMLPPETAEGELLFGCSHIEPGTVGEEFFMTRGHIHERAEQAEYYFGSAGEGLLVMQNTVGTVTIEKVFPGSVHHIPAHTAHRLVNTGSERLSALAVWPAVAGHNYNFLQEVGFKVRVLKSENGYKIVEAKEAQIEVA